MNDIAAADLKLSRTRLDTALDTLAAADPDVARAIGQVGRPPLRRRPPGFPTLLRIITAQQLSTKSAAAIHGRLEAALGDVVRPDTYLELDDDCLRGCGLSARKVEYGRHLAVVIADGRLDLDTLAELDDETAIEALTALPGFGRWSAEIYLLFALDRLDVLPADDLALQIAFQRLKGLDGRPRGKAFRGLTEGWAPWRGAGSILLWHFYGAATLDAT
jgi:DNA-3-methyladenine glycosylase II